MYGETLNTNDNLRFQQKNACRVIDALTLVVAQSGEDPRNHHGYLDGRALKELPFSSYYPHTVYTPQILSGSLTTSKNPQNMRCHVPMILFRECTSPKNTKNQVTVNESNRLESFPSFS